MKSVVQIWVPPMNYVENKFTNSNVILLNFCSWVDERWSKYNHSTSNAVFEFFSEKGGTKVGSGINKMLK